MRAPWCPFATRKEIDGWPTGGFRDTVNRKAVWHTTQGSDGGLLEWYKQGGGIPHFTIFLDGEIMQHYSCNVFSRALQNQRGGVETNTDGAIQIEIVGYAGKEHTAAQRESIRRLGMWISKEDHVAPSFPMGRLSKPYTVGSFDQWDNGQGHWAHAQVPEQLGRTDPDMTDATWAALEAGVLDGTWVAPPLTAIEIRQRQLWAAGFARPPHTERSYESVEDWADGFDGPETQAAQAAFNAAQVQTVPKPEAPAPLKRPRFDREDLNDLAAAADTVGRLTDVLVARQAYKDAQP